METNTTADASNLAPSYPSNAWLKAFTIVTIFTAVLSILGSSLILRRIHIQSREKKLASCLQLHKLKPYMRILLALSLSDVYASIIIAISAFTDPKDASSFSWSFGNETTCSVFGFLSQLTQLSLWYNAALRFYFMFTIRWGILQDTFSKYFESFLHLAAIAWPLATAIYGLVEDVYQPLDESLFCWISNDNPGLAWWFGGIPFTLCVLFIVINNVIIYCFVRTIVQGTAARSIHNINSMRETITANNNDNNIRSSRRGSFLLRGSNSTAPSSLSPQSSPGESNVRTVATQAFLYIGSFVVSYIWVYALGILQLYTQNNPTSPLALLMRLGYHIFHPLQGLWNALIFCRPRYVRYRRLQQQQQQRLQRRQQQALQPDPSITSTEPRTFSQQSSTGNPSIHSVGRVQMEIDEPMMATGRWEAFQWAVVGPEELPPARRHRHHHHHHHHHHNPNPMYNTDQGNLHPSRVYNNTGSNSASDSRGGVAISNVLESVDEAQRGDEEKALVEGSLQT